MKANPMSVLSASHRAQLIANGKANLLSQHTHINNIPPVCWIFDELSCASWLLTEIDRSNPARAWGLADSGDGHPDFKAIDLNALERRQRKVVFDDGTSITVGTEAVPDWTARGPISAYIAAAAAAGRIVELEPDLAAPHPTQGT